MRLTRTSQPALTSRPPSDRGLKGFPCGLALHFESLSSLGLVAARPRRVKQRVAYLSRYYHRGSGESCVVAQNNVISLSKHGLLWEPTYFFQRELMTSFPESSITTTNDILPNSWVFFTHPAFLCCRQQAILPPSIGIAQAKENCAVGSFTPAADMWTYGLDQFDRPCW